MDTNQTETGRTERKYERRSVGETAAVTADPGYKRISWSAIFAGAAFAAGISLFLYSLGLGIGGLTVDPNNPGQELRNLAIPSGIWAGVSMIIAMFFGGWAAGRLSPSVLRTEGVLHGLVTWGFLTVALVYLVGSAVGSVLGGAAGMAQSALPAASQQASQGDMQRMKEQASSTAQSLKEQAPQAVGKASNVLGKGSLAGAIGILLGGIAAAVGGAVGAGGRVRSTRDIALPRD